MLFCTEKKSDAFVQELSIEKRKRNTLIGGKNILTWILPGFLAASNSVSSSAFR